jgi:hypothetical protein
MSATTETPASTTAIRPFTLPAIPKAELEAVRVRIMATRWPGSVVEPLNVIDPLTNPTARELS